MLLSSDHLAHVLARRRAWSEARRAVEASLALDPFRAEARALSIAIHLETGERARAAAEFDVLGVVQPDHRERIREWFNGRMRQLD
jgi:hypothetical protein